MSGSSAPGCCPPMGSCHKRSNHANPEGCDPSTDAPPEEHSLRFRASDPRRDGLAALQPFCLAEADIENDVRQLPFPGNLIENNTIEFINVYVKPGKPPKFAADVKGANKLTRTEWLDLAQQVWFMYPEDVKREGNHPAPFPEKLRARLMRLYTFGAVGRFPGEVVLDPFVGTGTTCAVAKRMGRRYVGIDIEPSYVGIARRRVEEAPAYAPQLLVGRARYPGKDKLKEMANETAGSSGKVAAAKHKRKSYGRRLKNADQLTLV